jgi:anti-repressor protein
MTKEKNVVEIIKEQEVLGKAFRIYGTVEQPLFLAKDVAEMIKHSKPRDMVQNVDDEEKVKMPFKMATSRSTQEQWFLTEDGLYEVLMQSRKPIAKQFKKEVKNILKQMRLTGGSVVSGREEDFVEFYFSKFSDDTKLAMVKDLQEQNDKMKNLIQEQSKSVAFVKLVNETNGTKSMKEFADTLGIVGLGRNTLYELLREMEIILWNDTIPYRKYIDQGYLAVNESIARNGELVCSTRITPKGQVWLTKKILKHLDKTKASVSDEARDYAKSMIVDVQHRSEEELNAMCIHPQLFRDEWEGVASFARELKDSVTYLEIQELLSEI